MNLKGHFVVQSTEDSKEVVERDKTGKESQATPKRLSSFRMVILPVTGSDSRNSGKK